MSFKCLTSCLINDCGIGIRGVFIAIFPFGLSTLEHSEKISLSNRNPFLPYGQTEGKSGFKTSEIDLTGIANMNAKKVAFIKGFFINKRQL